MNETERRQEILKAEEVIRLLAKKMEWASETASQAEGARRKLDEAREAMNQANKKVEEAIKSMLLSGNKSQEAINLISKEALKALQEASEMNKSNENQIKTASSRLLSVAQVIEKSPHQLSEKLTRALSELNGELSRESNKITSSLDIIRQTMEDIPKKIIDAINNKTVQITTLIRWTIILAALAFAATSISIIISIIK